MNFYEQQRNDIHHALHHSVSAFRRHRAALTIRLIAYYARKFRQGSHLAETWTCGQSVKVWTGAEYYSPMDTATHVALRRVAGWTTVAVVPAAEIEEAA